MAVVKMALAAFRAGKRSIPFTAFCITVSSVLISFNFLLVGTDLQIWNIRFSRDRFSDISDHIFGIFHLVCGHNCRMCYDMLSIVCML